MLVERMVKKDDSTVIIYLDNSEKLFLSYEVLIKNGLRKGSEISEDRFSFLVAQNRKYHIRQKAISFLSRRMHSARELENKLRQKNYEKELIVEVLDELIDKRVIDDRAFAIQYTDEKINGKKWGIMKVRRELFKKGISPETVDQTLKNYSVTESQVDNALIIAKKKLNIISKREDDKKILKQKIISFLISRGFSYEVAVETVNSLLNTDEFEYE